MISHEHKCIFIHISKCAGTSVERALGLKNRELNYDILYGWCPKNRLYLQHATPQQLLDFGYINKEDWDSYYKFIIIRNPWDRAYSDYLWAISNENLFDSFSNFLYGKGKFKASLSKKKDYNISDHLYPQNDYFSIDGTIIAYDKIIRFEYIMKGLHELAEQLSIPIEVFNKQENVNRKRFKHYSLFFTERRKNLVKQRYAQDINSFDYTFEDRRNFLDGIKARLLFMFHPNGGRYFLLKYPKFGNRLVSIKKLLK